MSIARGNATDLLQQVIEQAVEVAVRKVLEGNTAGNRRLLSPEETATYLSMSKRENYNMIANGQIAVVTHGQRKMLDIRDVDEWIDHNKR